ncbi:hypothetical protein GCM10018781_64290 [Kitasatospora indigofera]|uniref:Uncharacterized protein n=2 Tax=Kitasatospora indigofera TaxID=67307 RepID=A0A919L2H4_9ACTN|nr:hypothetical protein GCM10018781_64290 [Kitasatospora indigofera]
MTAGRSVATLLVMMWFALGTFMAGGVGMMVGSKCERGWANWVRWQRITVSVSAVVALAGLALMDATKV